MADAFLSAGDVDSINALRLSGLATRMAVGQAIDLTLWRDTDAGGVSVGPTRVVMELADRRDTALNAPAARVSGMDGTFTAFAPWDVRPGDRFAIPGGLTGHVRVVPPADHGTQAAVFVLEE